MITVQALPRFRFVCVRVYLEKYPSRETVSDRLDPTLVSGNTTVQPLVTLLEYEQDIDNGKRRIKVLKKDYLDTVYNDMKNIFKYKKSSQYRTPFLKEAHNPRLSGS